MDPTSAFRTEVFRPLMTLVVPGATAVAPFALVVRHYNPVVSGFFERHAVLGLTVLALASLAAGFLIENIGSQIEVCIDSKKKDSAYRKEVWNRYLGLAFAIEPVGQRYLRTILLRMKFELHFAIALLASTGGWLWLQVVSPLWTTIGFRVFAGATVLCAAYLLCEAWWSADTLHQTRETLVAGHRGQQLQGPVGSADGVGIPQRK